MALTDKITVAIAGAAGRMGTEATRAIQADPRFDLRAVLVHSGQAVSGVPAVYEDRTQLLTEVHPDVWLDFTDATAVVANIDAVVDAGVRPVIGATGYTLSDIERWHDSLTKQGLGGIAAPNFAVGALLMIRFAAEAAKLYQNAEIIELHHDGKKDAPSGTAKRTAQAIGAAREEEKQPPIHSVRLPGLVAHQEVIFGGVGETLTIRHDSIDRTSFMPGVVLACEKVMGLTGMVYGLEHLLW